MKYVLFLIAILFSNQAVALDCVKQPTCEELNYSKENVADCAEDGYLLCPFDFNYKKCVEHKLDQDIVRATCESLGFLSPEKRTSWDDWCEQTVYCPFEDKELSPHKKHALCKTIKKDYEPKSYSWDTVSWVREKDNEE